MSRKRTKNKRSGDAVPAEVLAEGSGPNEVIDANPQALVEAANGLVEKRRGKKGRGKAPETPEPDTQQADSDDGSDNAYDDALAETVADDTLPEVHAADDLAEVVAAEEADARNDEHDELDAAAASKGHADAVALDASGGNLPPPDEPPTPEAEAEAAVEDAVMRAEADAELRAAAAAAVAQGLEGDPVESGEDELSATLPTTAASMDAAQLKNLVEALVFAADKPVTVQRLRQLTRVSDVKRLEDALAEITVDFADRGIALQQVSGGYQFRTNTRYSVWVQQLIAGRPVRLSRAQLETLAIIAYRQPITRPEMDEIRGVDSSATLRLLLDRSLIRTLGKKEDVGRPMLYGTTKDFLDFSSLGDLRELPTLREYSELTPESRKVMTDRLGDEAYPDEEPHAELDPEADSAAAVDAVAAVDSSASASEGPILVNDTIERDPWGQVITSHDDETAAFAVGDDLDDDRDPEELVAAGDESAVITDEKAQDVDAGDAVALQFGDSTSAEVLGTESNDGPAEDGLFVSSDESESESSNVSATSDEGIAALSPQIMSETSDESALASSAETMSEALDESASESSDEALSASPGEVSRETSEESSMVGAATNDEELSSSDDDGLSGSHPHARARAAAVADAAAETMVVDDELDSNLPAEGSSADDEPAMRVDSDGERSESLDVSDEPPAE